MELKKIEYDSESCRWYLSFLRNKIVKIMMEYEGKFYGSGEDSLFKLDVLENRRT